MVNASGAHPHFSLGGHFATVHVWYHWCTWIKSPNILEAAQKPQLWLTHFHFPQESNTVLYTL
jgi:hypothetical protein